MALFRPSGDEGRARRAPPQKSKPGRAFSIERPESRRLEERALLSLTFTSLPIPLVGLVQPTSIVTGPDGNLWFSETGAGRIGRMTPSGALTEFTLPAQAARVGSSPGSPDEPAEPQGITVGPDGALWFTTSDSEIGRITTSGAVTEFPVPGLTTPNSTITTGPDGNLWFTGISGDVGMITPSGQVTTFPVPVPASGGSWPTVNTIVAGPDGALWFTTSDDGIGRVTTSGSFTMFNLPSIGPPSGTTDALTPVSATGLAAGPDGALWFTASDGEIGRITTAGTVTYFATPAQVDTGSSIVAGPDGDLWFTLGNGQIGRITPSGTVTTFPVPGTFATLAGLTSGPDGQIWFTEEEDGTTAGQQPAIGQITPDGAITLHALPQGTTLDPNRGVPVDPDAITAGPDGAVWFTENAGIGRVTRSGAFQQFVLPASAGQPGQIITGPDGALWFTDSTGIGRITTGGVIQQFALPASAGEPSQIIAGPDGALWFTDSTGIGRITTTGSTTLFPLSAGSPASDLVAGPDGNIWFTDAVSTAGMSNPIVAFGRITPQGAIALFPFGETDAEVTGLTSGPDGDLWFTGEDQPAATKNATPFLGRLTPLGQVKVFDVAGGKSPITGEADQAPAPVDPVAVVDGRVALLGTYQGRQGLLQFSAQGKLAKFSKIRRGTGNLPSHLTPLASGEFLFTDGSDLEVVTRSGAVIDHPNVAVNSMTAGPDGTAWITSGSATIIRVKGLETPPGGSSRPKTSG